MPESASAALDEAVDDLKLIGMKLEARAVVFSASLDDGAFTRLKEAVAVIEDTVDRLRCETAGCTHVAVFTRGTDRMCADHFEARPERIDPFDLGDEDQR